MSVHNVSGQHLTNMGVGKEKLLGYGKYSKQRVPRLVRHRFEKTLEKYADDYIVYLEALNCCKFMYYTSARIKATLSFRFSVNRFELLDDMWVFEVIDKGGIKWKKIFVGHSLKEIKEYCSERFKIPLNELELKLPQVSDHLFPSFVNNDTIKDDKLREMVKPALIEAGLSYRKFPPLHIWRHTFAQDFLSASDWNYELCASLGGWKSTKILKEVYGEMGLNPRVRGLKKSMGLGVEEERHELK